MSRHNITGSEAFDEHPILPVRSVRSGKRRGKNRTVVAFATGVILALGAVAGTVAVLFGGSLAGL